MKKISTFALGLIVGISLTAATSVGAATIYLKAIPKTVKIVVGDSQKSVEAMNVNSKLYIPVRDAGDSFGYSVSGVTSSAVTFQEGVSVGSSETGSNKSKTESSNVGGEYVQGLHDKYSTDGILDVDKVKAGIAAAEITVNAQDKETGNSLLHYVIKENNFAVYNVIKVNSLNVNLQNKEGNTPLHTAIIEKNNFYFGELINQYKADAKIKNNQTKQPIDLSEKNSSEYIMLKGYMM
ncbi:hypothetical protein [Paenibacillus sp. FSL H3-0286]|uniref:hypothetical protein n=1 Tax=Paenibacillus sp. FSL H3-0286 TaxID=2921427 RepID=UPI00324D1986